MSDTQTVVDTVQTDNLARLTKMRDVAHSFLLVSGIKPERWRIAQEADRHLSIGLWWFDLTSSITNWTQSQWSIFVSAPNDWRDNHDPAKLFLNGSATPLSLRVLNALDALMWEDRER